MQLPTSNSRLPKRLMVGILGVAVVIAGVAADLQVRWQRIADVAADLQVRLHSIPGLAADLVVRFKAQARQVPVFEPDPLWSQALPNKWATGAVGGIAV